MRKFKELIPALKISAIIAFVLLFTESIENYIFFSSYFPRANAYSVIVNRTILKFLTLPLLQLAGAAFALYIFIIFFFVFTIAVLYYKLKPVNKLPVLWFGLLAFVSIYFALYFVYGFNAFLHPRSQVQHFILYQFVFPRPELPVPFIIAGFYWIFLFIFTIAITKNKLLSGLLSFAVIFAVSTISVTRYFPDSKKFAKKDNVVFIGLDSLQYNRLSKRLGYEKDLAPNADKFIRNAVCFKNAWTPLARTYPAYISILTGRYPIHTGARANLVPDYYLNPGNAYLGNILKQHDYYCLYCTDDVRFSNIRPMHGFDEVFCPRKDIAAMFISAFYDYAFCNILIQNGALPALFKPVIYNRSHVAYNPMLFINKVIRRINNLPRNKKQFIAVHLCVNHHPYSIAYPYARDKNLINPHEQCIRALDEQLGVLLKYLKACGLYDNSVVVLFSDHGDGWDYGGDFSTHGNTFYYPWSNRMVLALYSNGILPMEIDNTAAATDIYPTLLDSLGIAIPKDIDGRSLMPLVKGEYLPETAIFAETGYGFQINNESNASEVAKKVRSQMKRFKVNENTGYLFLQDADYADIIRKKWYMMLENGMRYVYSP
ncbi:MAG: sulfatase-like hydrolase/transferase, partial [Candidatus Omnitrophica bacterium]|nr:sulfatase-like hydrolase/transferase [Candidatus Omnitrophota bacterium]